MKEKIVKIKETAKEKLWEAGNWVEDNAGKATFGLLAVGLTTLYGATIYLDKKYYERETEISEKYHDRCTEEYTKFLEKSVEKMFEEKGYNYPKKDVIR